MPLLPSCLKLKAWNYLVLLWLGGPPSCPVLNKFFKVQNYGVEDEWWFACYASSKNQPSIFLLHWGGDEANLHHAFSRISSCASKDYASL